MPTTRSAVFALYPNMGMHPNAEFIVALHPRAIDYLEQAPILAAGFGVKGTTKTDRLYVASRIGGPIQRGERLRNVMAALGLQTPLRKLCGYAVVPYVAKFVRELNDLSPSTLSQCIPDEPGPQRQWLKALKDYRRRMEARNRSPRLGFHWIARHAHLCERGQSEDIADFIAMNADVDYERWSLLRMNNEVQLWHDRLAADASVKGLGMSIRPDTLIDLSGWPDHVETEHFEFFKLSTPSMIMEEGRKMRHCVASYIRTVIDGQCHLYSMRADMRRIATVEIVGGNVVQIKGFANKIAAQSAVDAAKRFARDHNPKRPTPEPHHD